MIDETKTVSSERNYEEVLGDIVNSTKELLKNNIQLLKSQLNDSFKKIEKHAVQLIVLGGLMIVASLPILFSAIWGLGILLNLQFWLSSLIVGILFTTVVALLMLRVLKKLKDDFNIDLAQKNIEQSSETLMNSVSKIKNALTGGYT